MDYRKKTTEVDPETLMEMLHSVSAEDLADQAEKTAIKYLKVDEEAWLKRRVEDGVYAGISTGYNSVDNLMGSFLPGELFTIGGDTGHGKSLFAMNIAQNAYQKEQRPVLMVNLELTEDQARARFYNLSGEEHDYFGIMVQEKPSVAYKDIDVLMKKAKAEGACLVVIDHLHFFSRSAENQTAELSRIMKHFKECAVENELPVVLLSHVTPTRIMDKDGRVKKTLKPGLHNFKGSSSIEQDSDMVGFVYRAEDTPKQVEFYMRKNRSRPLNPESVYLNQKEWKLEEIDEWVPKNLPPHGA